MDMKITATEIPPSAQKYPASPIRIVILACIVTAIYGGGILMAVRAGYATIASAHAGGPIPYFEWSLAFFFVILGMLSVIYAFFFRPREARLSEDLIALVWWDGSCKALSRSEVVRVDCKGSKIRIEGKDLTLNIPNIFSNQNILAEKLKTW